MCTYLAKRGATYYFRRAISAELRPAFNGAAEFMRSLKTKDRETAKALLPGHTIETNQLLRDARARLAHAAPERAAQRVDPVRAAAERAEFEAMLEGRERGASSLPCGLAPMKS
ncbi:DUF6538 domain-containing protein [Sphingomonas sp. ID0503]|uniref:DUF6538 domain-containing protein n=1 Tax=Sphingomonas sp. ID0503 TaxID=3399691 RepID=UPI003AFB40F7